MINKEIPYNFPAERCHAVLRDEVLPDLRFTWSMGYSFAKQALMRLRASVEDDDPDAGRIVFRFKEDDSVVKYRPPKVRVYCKPEGTLDAIVRFVPESLEPYNSRLLTAYATGTARFAKRSRLGRAYLSAPFWPRYYIDNELVFQPSDYLTEEDLNNLSIRAFDYMLRVTHAKLRACLEE